MQKIEWLLNLAAYRARKNKAPHPLKSWLNRPVASFTKQDVAEVIGGLKRRGKIETAHRTLHCLVRLFKYAVGTERTPKNPAQAFTDSGGFESLSRHQSANTLRPTEFLSVLACDDAGALVLQQVVGKTCHRFFRGISHAVGTLCGHFRTPSLFAG